MARTTVLHFTSFKLLVFICYYFTVVST